MPTLTAAQVAALVKQVGFPENVRVTMVAIARAESGYRVEAVGGPNSNGTYDRDLFQINDVHGLDRNKLTTDATYNAEAAKRIYDSQGLRAWSVYNSGKWKDFEAEARQGVAQASSATGSVVTPGTDSAAGGGGTPSVTYGGPGPQLTDAGVGQPLAANAPGEGGLGVVKILGVALEGDIGSTVIGTPQWSAGLTTVPHLQLTCIDENFVLFNRGLWRHGSRVQWSDLDLRIDVVTLSNGSVGTGQVELTCVDDIVYALMGLRGPRTASGISASEWLAQELTLAGIDPRRYLLAEAVPTQSAIARDVPDQSGQAGDGQQASAWTTIVRLAKELGKYVFISGRRIVFGSAAFAMQWTAEGPLRIGGGLPAGEAWPVRPTTTTTSISSREGTLQISGRVGHERAPFFRPGAPVDVTGTTAIAHAGEFVRMMVWSIDHTLVNDVDGAEIVLVRPVDPPPQPPTQTTSAGTNGSDTSSDKTGSNYDSKAAQIVALCLQQVGKQYIYGAEAQPSDPNPRAFDCCLTIDSMISTGSRGPLPVADVVAGDTVWCWDAGTLAERKVVAVAEQPVQPVFAVKTRNSTVRASANHPFLVLRRADRKRDARGSWLPVEWRSEWTRLDKLAKGDLLVSLERTPIAADPVALSDGTVIGDDVAWLLGEIIGDGHVTDSGVFVAAFRPAIRERIREIVVREWGAKAVDHETHGIMVSSRRLRDTLTDLGMRVPGHEKRVPDLLRTLSAAPLRAFLAGYAEADGHFDKRGHQSYGSCSRRLIDDVRALHRMLGDKVSNVTVTKRTRPIVIKGKTVKNARPLHSFAAYPDSTRRNGTVLDVYGARRALPDRSFTVEKITSITPDGEEPTFDLEIEGAHNYVADGLVVHNSEILEWACARAQVSPKFPDGTDAQEAHCRRNGTTMSVADAIKTKGALLFQPGHVALSLGDGSTVEAMNSQRGVTKGNANGRGFTAGAKIPGASY